MSVLIAGNEPLLRRACIARQNWLLVDWFATVEALAWVAVEARYGSKRPDRIFLVTGQTLATEYALTHQEHNAVVCEATVEASVQLPSIVNAEVFLGHGLKKASASIGFDFCQMKTLCDGRPRQYSLFLETFESAPIKLLSRRLSTRIAAMHKYNPLHQRPLTLDTFWREPLAKCPVSTNPKATSQVQ
jgi:hypothetical protein